MNFFYWLALVLGGGLLGLSLISSSFGAHSDTHLGGTHDVDLSHHDDFDWGKLLSLRNLTYLLLASARPACCCACSGAEKKHTDGFGCDGGRSGCVVVERNDLRLSEEHGIGALPTDRMLVGRVGQVTLPLLPGGTGKVEVTRSEQTQELLAKPMDESEANPQSWGTVVIVEMRDGIAFVAPYSEANSSEN
jgi:hypothetical protein